MFFYFHSSHKKDLKQVGGFMNYCSCCDQQQPFAFFHRIQTDKVYGIKLAKTVIGKLMVCEVCGVGIDVDKKYTIKTIEPWTISVPISTYAKKLDYELIDPEITAVNSKTITALIRRIINTKASFNISVSWTASIWIILGAVLLGLLFGYMKRSGYGLFHTDVTGHKLIGYLAGGVIGLIGATVVQLVRYNKNKRIEELVRYMDKLGLTYDDVKGYVDEAGAMDDKVWGLLEKIKSFEQAYEVKKFA